MAQILLVDDDQDLIEMNRTVFAQRGHTVNVAYSSAEAQKIAQTEEPDLAVLDVMMEDKTAGFELARKLHALYPDHAHDHADGHQQGDAARLHVPARRNLVAGQQVFGKAHQSARAGG